ncbi:unnamed protein product [Hymenolepis diminuta]|uniref:CDC73_C domain-containing protein n=1 Tax=Hymenolepis diminuta TaxID=6216 RepID=A0A0R3SS62_HYMDI|nr:unnamed protein product [Hymenolepis diminuta]
MRTVSRLVQQAKSDDIECVRTESTSEPNLHLFLFWVGEIYPNLAERQAKIIFMSPNQNKLTIGRRYIESTIFQFDEEELLTQSELSIMPEVSLSSQMTELPPAGIHSTITRCPDNSFVLSATALNKIFVNNKRVDTNVKLKEKDVITFGWPYNKPVQRGEVVDNFKFDLKYKVHICDGKATSQWHPFSVNPNFDEEHDFITRATIQYIRKFTWANREIASIVYIEKRGPTCVQLLRLMEEHRLKRDFALDLDRTKNKYIQFLLHEEQRS